MKRILSVFAILTAIIIALVAIQRAAGADPTPEAIAEVEAAIQDAIQQNREAALAYFAGGVTIDGTQISADEEWAVSYLIPTDPATGEPVPSEPGLTLARQGDAGWQVWLPTDSDMIAQINAAPDDILPPTQKTYWLEMYQTAEADMPSATLTGYLLPWDFGVTRYLSGSVCHDSYIPSKNAHFAFDFYTTKTMWDILAIKGGTVQVARWDVPNGNDSDMGNYLVIKDATTNPVTYHLYLHLAQDSIPEALRVKGAPIARGQFIGIADDTGASTGHHLHLQVQVAIYGEDHYWGRSVDFAFDDVDINSGHPRISASWCQDGDYCEAGDICNSFRNSYTSQNVRTDDITPPTGQITSPATGTTVNTDSVNIQGTATDTGDGVKSVQFLAYFNGTWQNVGAPITANPSSPAYTWNWCHSSVPDGPVSLAMSITDFANNTTAFTSLRHVIKQFACTPPVPACQPTADQVALFTEPDFRGTCALLGTGTFTTSLGTLQSNAASLQVGSNVMATLYLDTAATQRGETFLASDSYLFDNRIGADSVQALVVAPRTSMAAEDAPLIVSVNPLEAPVAVTALTVPFTETFETVSSDWSGTGLWHRTVADNHTTPSGSWSWWYQDIDGNYDTGSTNSGVLTSTQINIPASSTYYLRFYYKTETESAYGHWDQRWLQISENGGAFTNVMQFKEDPMNIWLASPSINLSAYAGKNIRLRFVFDTIDANRNNFDGWGIDDLSITTTAPPSCAPDGGVIAYGQTKTGAICPNGNVDIYTFNGSAGDVIGANLQTPGSSLDPYLTLLDASGNILAENDDKLLDVDADSRIQYRLPATGIYTLQVRAWDHPSAGGSSYTYQLTLYNETTRPTITLTNPLNNGYIPEDPFTLTADASDTTGVESVAFYWHDQNWQSASGWKLIGTDTDGSNGWSFTALANTFQPDQPQVAIYAAATDKAGNVAFHIAYNLTIDHTPPTSALIPFNGTLGSNVIPLSWSGSDNLSGLQKFELKRSVNSSENIQTFAPEIREAWDVVPAGATYYYRLQAVDNADNAEGYPTNPEGTAIIPPAATLCSEPDSWEMDNTPISATLVTTDTLQLHNFCNPAVADFRNDEDWLQINVTAGNSYLVSITPTDQSSAVVIEIYASDGTTLLKGPVMSSDYGLPVAISWSAPTNGVNYIRLRHVNGNVIGNATHYAVQVGEARLVYLPMIGR